ncbi:MAG: helix-turn-helix transcriptional regulator [Gemmatimonadota bacterium]
MRDSAQLGERLRHWRAVRGRTQGALADAAGISARHMSFIETGRSRPSRSVLLRLADALEVPLREQNALLEAAGLSREFRETPLDAPGMAHTQRMLALLLERTEPYPAVVVDPAFNVLMANRAQIRLHARCLRQPPLPSLERPNLVRAFFDADGLKPAVLNWEEAAAVLWRRLQRELAERPTHPGLVLLLEELSRRADVRRLDVVAPTEPSGPWVPLSLRLVTGETIRLVTLIASFGTAIDVALEELRLESFLPADEPSAALLRTLAESGD